MSDHKRILLIDDDKDIVQAIAIRLIAMGCTVITALDGQEGYAKALSELPDAIVLDIRMPGMNGLETLKMLRDHSKTASIPVVMLSASLMDQKEASDRGARFFLEKPYDAETLKAAIQTAMMENAQRSIPS